LTFQLLLQGLSYLAGKTDGTAGNTGEKNSKEKGVRRGERDERKIKK